jgi:hypothetical protein
MGGRARGHRFTQGRPPALYPHGVTTEEAKQQTLADVVKGCSKHEFTHHPNSSHDAPSTLKDMATVSKTGPTIVVGLLQLRVLRQNPPSWVRATQSKQSEGRRDTKGG